MPTPPSRKKTAVTTAVANDAGGGANAAPTIARKGSQIVTALCARLDRKFAPLVSIPTNRDWGADTYLASNLPASTSSPPGTIEFCGCKAFKSITPFDFNSATHSAR